MARIGITAKEIFKVAETLVAQGKTPTQDTIREYLGRGSKGTIHKYLKQWKQNCFKKGSLNSNTIDLMDPKTFFEEKDVLDKTIQKQLDQNEQLTAQLVDTERRLNQVQEKNQQLMVELEYFKRQYTSLEAEHKILQEAYQVLREGQNKALQTLIEDKNQLVESLRQELREVNQASLAQVREMGYQGDEALMEEKVKSLNLQEKVSALEKELSSLQQQLAREQQANQPLRNEIEKQRRLIENTVTFPQLKTMENGSIPETGEL